MNSEHETSWAAEEFGEVRLGDKRLDARLIKLCDRFADAPESPINQACADWAETKAAYRFFQNENVAVGEIVAAHRDKTVVRANADRTINRRSRYAEKGVEKLWDHMREQPETGTYTIEIPHRSKTKHCKEREARTATVSIRFGSFRLNPPRNNAKHSQEDLPDIHMNAVYVLEQNPPEGEEPLEWMLLTNLPVTSFEEAYEKVCWYCLRWRIEMYFKVLKSGFRVETCRLEHADRLTRYLAVMSIVAWRLFMITLIARTDPATPCSTLLADHEWKVLFLKATGSRSLPQKPPSIGHVVIWVAKLGGYLARKNDGPPGTISLWRGWKRLADLMDGWQMAVQS